MHRIVQWLQVLPFSSSSLNPSLTSSTRPDHRVGQPQGDGWSLYWEAHFSALASEVAPVASLPAQRPLGIGMASPVVTILPCLASSGKPLCWVWPYSGETQGGTDPTLISCWILGRKNLGFSLFPLQESLGKMHPFPLRVSVVEWAESECTGFFSTCCTFQTTGSRHFLRVWLSYHRIKEKRSWRRKWP